VLARSHFKRGENGGFYVSKTALGVGSFLLAVLAALASIVGTAATMKNDIGYLQVTQSDIKDLSQSNKNDIEVLKVQINNINSNVQEIKTDVKYLRDNT